MQVTFEVPEGVFRKPKTPEQVVAELRQAAAIFWLARGDVAPEAVPVLTDEAPAARTQPLMDLLLAMPDVGDDAVFERVVEFPGEPLGWDT